MVSTQVDYGKRFLKQLRDGASAMSLSRLFHCGIVRGKNEFLQTVEDAEMFLNLQTWFALVRESADIRCEDGTATSTWTILNMVVSL